MICMYASPHLVWFPNTQPTCCCKWLFPSLHLVSLPNPLALEIEAKNGPSQMGNLSTTHSLVPQPTFKVRWGPCLGVCWPGCKLWRNGGQDGLPGQARTFVAQLTSEMVELMYTERFLKFLTWPVFYWKSTNIICVSVVKSGCKLWCNNFDSKMAP